MKRAIATVVESTRRAGLPSLRFGTSPDVRLAVLEAGFKPGDRVEIVAERENARLRELMEDVASHLYVEGVDAEGGWQCVECGRPQPELKSYAVHVEGCSVGAFEAALGYSASDNTAQPASGK